MILYYAIIAYCLSGACSNVESMERYIYEELLPYEQCLTTLPTMINEVRKRNPEAKHRPISTLCVQKDFLKNKEGYKVWYAQDNTEG